MQPNVYLKDLVARVLAERGLPGRVEIHPHRPFADRLESGERARFIVEYHGDGITRLVLDEYEVSSGTVGAPVAVAIADAIERARRAGRVAA